MKSLGTYLLARLGERSTRVQLIVLVAAGVVSTGLVTVEQVSSWTGTMLGLVAVVGPLAAALNPDAKAEVPAEVVTNAAIAAAQAAAEKLPGFDKLNADMSEVANAAEDALRSALPVAG